MNIDLEKCVGCGTCVQDCPLGAIRLKKKKAAIDDRCSQCGACMRVCPEEAITVGDLYLLEGIQCDACPIECRGPDPAEAIRKPLITGIGAGTTYPDCKPAPYIVKAKQHEVDVVTVVTEAPLSYSGIMVKIDTDIPIGEEGAAVMAGKRKVGLVVTEQYGSKMLSIGGVNLLTGKDGMGVARTITDLANKKPVKLRIDGGCKLEIQVGQPPLIDGVKPDNMRVGCGSATLGLFSPLLKEAADEAIILDSHLTGLMSEHAAGRFVGAKPSGIRLKFRKSTPGRYFGDHGKGWGGTSILHPLEVIAGIDQKVARPGMRILVTETTARSAAMFELQKDGSLKEISLSDAAGKVLEAISSCAHFYFARGWDQFHGGCGESEGKFLLLDSDTGHHLPHRVHYGAQRLRSDGRPS